MDNTQLLEIILLTGTPQEAADFFDSHYDINTGRALAVACRFCGLEYVQALVEGYAEFPDDDEYETPNYWLAPLNFYETQRRWYRAAEGEDWFENKIERKLGDSNSAETFYVLSEEQRAEIAAYLCEKYTDVCTSPNKLLFCSIMCRNQIITARLRKMGVTFTNIQIATFTEDSFSVLFNEFIDMLTALGDDVIADVFCDIVKQLGGKRICYNKTISNYHTNFFSTCSLYRGMGERLFNPDIFKSFLRNFRLIATDRRYLLMELIDQNRIECLAMCAEQGWLKQPHIRDEIIEYASEVKRTECTAWLLDYKNREFDLAAERAKAEKKALHELNAPYSIAAMKNTWRWRKKEDGTLVITGYKGTEAVIKIPPQIGRRAVTALGNKLFYGYEIRGGKKRNITNKIILPNGLRTVGKECFSGCGKLEEMTIPDGVVKIGKGAFSECKMLKTIVIPASIKQMGKDVFFLSDNVTVTVERGSYAEEYCRLNNVSYNYNFV